MSQRRQYDDRPGIHVEWVTIRHRTIYSLLATAVLLLGGAGAFYYFVFHAPPEIGTASEPEVALNTSARFIEISGNVTVRKAATYAWVDARMGIPLTRDDHVRTNSKATARIRFFDGTEYLVKPDTILVIEESHEDPATNVRRVAVKLTAGQVNLQTPTKNVEGSISELATPNTEARFDERTVADVRYDQSNRVSGFTIFRGATDLEAGGKSVKLGSSEEVEISAENTFSEIVRLPGIPSATSPAHLSTIVHRDPARSNTELKWGRVDGAHRYHVLLDRTPNFSDPLWDSKVRGLSAVVPGLAPGAYYWKVSAEDGEERQGGYSDFAKFIISSRARTNTPPKLLVAPPTATLDGVVTFNGTTDPDAVVTVNNERVSVRPDGSFQHYFIIGRPGRHEIIVKAFKRSGGTAEKVFQVTIGSEGP